MNLPLNKIFYQSLFLTVYLLASFNTVQAEQCGLPYIDIWDSTDPNAFTKVATVKTIETSQTGKQHYNYYSASGHPVCVNLQSYAANTWIHQNTITNDLTFGFIFSKQYGGINNSAKLNFRIVDSSTDPYVSQSDDPGEAVESPPGSNAFVGRYNYVTCCSDGIAVSGIGGAEWTVIVDSVDFGKLTSWFFSGGTCSADYSDDFQLTMKHEYRVTPACHPPSGKPVVVTDKDTDEDGIKDEDDNCPYFANEDQTDSDDDGLGDVCDPCLTDPYNMDSNSNGICDVDEFADTDGDGIADDVDNCINEVNEGQEDVDGDGVGDVCDECPLANPDDSDDDGVCQDIDNCSFDFNPDQYDSEGDGIGDICDIDDDNDGIADDNDNCPFDFNPDQRDDNLNGVGYACEGDSDEDGVMDDGDQCLETLPGSPVNQSGCSIAQNCWCANSWKNHGAYVSCVAHASEELFELGVITGAEKDAICSEAGRSDCGSKKKK